MLSKKYYSIKNNKSFNNKLVVKNKLFFLNDTNNELFKKLNKYKEYINEIELKNWNKYKQYTYNYEYVYNIQSDFTLVKYNPISRSYFKLLEIMKDEIKLSNKKMTFCFLAECPGGFIDYIINSRKHLFCKDEYYTISLISNKKSVPSYYLLNKKYDNVHILKGVDNKGDLCNIDNIKYLKEKIKVDFVTADGGFDFTENYDNQEMDISNLLFCEIISAFSILNKDGIFILKVFDLYSSISFNLIYLLSLYFDDVKITKPHISKPANSEKYIICNNFKGIKEEHLELFYDIIKNKKKLYLNIDKSFIDYLTKINIYYTVLQINSILHTIILFKLNLPRYYLLFINFKQFVYSILWCIKYNQLINYRISFFRLNYKKKINNILFLNQV